MKVKAKRLFVSPIHGNVKEGDVITVTETQAKHFHDLGLIELPAPKKPEPKKTSQSKK